MWLRLHPRRYAELMGERISSASGAGLADQHGLESPSLAKKHGVRFAFAFGWGTHEHLHLTNKVREDCRLPVSGQNPAHGESGKLQGRSH